MEVLSVHPCQHVSPESVHHWWPNLDEFLEALPHVPDGLQSIGLERGLHLDVLLKGRPLNPEHSNVAVFFNGAVTSRRHSMPPFLSGAGVSQRLGIPLISVADPSLTLDDDLGLAWYLGPQGVDVQSAIGQVLRRIAETSGNHLWMVGGSGGGFAALQAAQVLGDSASAFVWNPQTDVLNYAPELVKRYLAVAFPKLQTHLGRKDWKDIARWHLQEDGKEWEISGGVSDGLKMTRLLWLQNWNDWHTRIHALPWIASAPGFRESWPGIYASDDDHVLWLTETGNGHAPPTAKSVQKLLELCLGGVDNVLSIARWQSESGMFPREHVSQYVRDLRPYSMQLEREIDVRFFAGRKVTPRSEQIDPEMGGLRFRYDLWNGSGLIDTRFGQLGASYITDVPGRDWDHLVVTAMDGMDHDLFAVQLHRPHPQKSNIG